MKFESVLIVESEIQIRPRPSTEARPLLDLIIHTQRHTQRITVGYTYILSFFIKYYVFCFEIKFIEQGFYSIYGQYGASLLMLNNVLHHVIYYTVTHTMSYMYNID